ncbi:MAG: DUF262 domain-containing protein [Acidiferrobacterales bacterium]|nr:DUF262 domain-containing protein [Acidiferrobacterales bacterium]
MGYKSLTIKETVNLISKAKFYLPAIQRKFVWREEKICELFDSIMRGYPIGTFLFWELGQEQANQYTFYKFLTQYHERDSKNELQRASFPHDIVGVLDGQQRLSSIYIALQGIYASKIKNSRWKNDDAFPERRFYLNIISEKNQYDFAFLTNEDAKCFSANKFYFEVRSILDFDNEIESDEMLELMLSTVSEEVLEIFQSQEARSKAKVKLSKLRNKLNKNELINYFRIENTEIDDILDIFVRVNASGATLSKSDLLFSNLVAHWEVGREEIEKLLIDMNGEDRLFNFNSDFLMRTFIFLIDAPMSFKVKTFDSKNIGKIKNNWLSIRKALIQTTLLLRKFGFSSARLSSNYAATLVAYYLFKGGVVDAESEASLEKFVRVSLLKQIYSGQADTALSMLRDGIRRKSSDNTNGYILNSTNFNFDSFKNVKLPIGKSLNIDLDDIDHFLSQKKGSFTFLLLSFLYPDIKLDASLFHQDHMHPYSKFSKKVLVSKEVDQTKLESWRDMRDQLPNLQFLTGKENVTKQAEFLSDWVSEKIENKAQYLEQNFINNDQSLRFSDFESFFEHRKSNIRTRLIEIFEVATLAKEN